jgi:pyruvate ferredoxin oxidoreductase gamma subunit
MLAAVVKASGILEEEQFVRDMENSFGHKFASKPNVISKNMDALKRSLQEVNGIE